MFLFAADLVSRYTDWRLNVPVLALLFGHFQVVVYLGTLADAFQEVADALYLFVLEIVLFSQGLLAAFGDDDAASGVGVGTVAWSLVLVMVMLGKALGAADLVEVSALLVFEFVL